jgi:hypothetical protein
MAVFMIIYYTRTFIYISHCSIYYYIWSVIKGRNTPQHGVTNTTDTSPKGFCRVKCYITGVSSAYPTSELMSSNARI